MHVEPSLQLKFRRGGVHKREIHRVRSVSHEPNPFALICFMGRYPGRYLYTRGIIPSCTMQEQTTEIRDSDAKVVAASRAA